MRGTKFACLGLTQDVNMPHHDETVGGRELKWWNADGSDVEHAGSQSSSGSEGSMNRCSRYLQKIRVSGATQTQADRAQQRQVAAA
jgi:hypothetical protein